MVLKMVEGVIQNCILITDTSYVNKNTQLITIERSIESKISSNPISLSR